MLSLDGATHFINDEITADKLNRMEDSEWEKQERLFHDAALHEVNALVRKYNTVAPYAVRKTCLDRSTELNRVYSQSGQAILDQLAASMANEMRGQTPASRQDSPSGHSTASKATDAAPARLRDIIRDFWRALTNKQD